MMRNKQMTCSFTLKTVFKFEPPQQPSVFMLPVTLLHQAGTVYYPLLVIMTSFTQWCHWGWCHPGRQLTVSPLFFIFFPQKTCDLF